MKPLLQSALFLIIGMSVAIADDKYANVEISATPIKGSVYMLQGAGGNIGVSAGDDGVLIIDDQFAPLAEKIASALGELGSNSPKYVINTHFHGDHTGSNAFFHEHKSATILAHENVRVRLASGEAPNRAALPVITYDTGIKIHFNNDTLHVFHLPSGHTDGDSVIWFEQSNVLHTGDLFFNGLFPFIDLTSGGTVEGYIAAVEHLLAKINDDTVIIPGHGPKGTKADYQRFLSMINETYWAVNAAKANGMTEQQIIDEGLAKKWKKWNWAFINEEKWIKTLYQGK